MKKYKKHMTSLIRAIKAGKPLTTAQAARFTGYTPDHLGLLVRRGSIKAEKLGRDWLIEPRSLYEYVKKKPKPGRKSF